MPAHLLALERIAPGKPRFFNAGIGLGYSVREVIDAARRVTGREIPVEFAAHRAGDPPELWANADSLRGELGWSPQFTRLDDVIATAWKWLTARKPWINTASIRVMLAVAKVAIRNFSK